MPRSLAYYAGLMTSSCGLVAADVMDRLAVAPGVPPWLNYGALGLTCLLLLRLYLRERQYSADREVAHAAQLAAEREAWLSRLMVRHKGGEGGGGDEGRQ